MAQIVAIPELNSIDKSEISLSNITATGKQTLSVIETLYSTVKDLRSTVSVESIRMTKGLVLHIELPQAINLALRLKQLPVFIRQGDGDELVNALNKLITDGRLKRSTTITLSNNILIKLANYLEEIVNRVTSFWKSVMIVQIVGYLGSSTSVTLTPEASRWNKNYLKLSDMHQSTVREAVQNVGYNFGLMAEGGSMQVLPCLGADMLISRTKSNPPLFDIITSQRDLEERCGRYSPELFFMGQNDMIGYPKLVWTSVILSETGTEPIVYKHENFSRVVATVYAVADVTVKIPNDFAMVKGRTYTLTVPSISVVAANKAKLSILTAYGYAHDYIASTYVPLCDVTTSIAEDPRYHMIIKPIEPIMKLIVERFQKDTVVMEVMKAVNLPMYTMLQDPNFIYTEAAKAERHTSLIYFLTFMLPTQLQREDIGLASESKAVSVAFFNKIHTFTNDYWIALQT